MGYNGRFYYSLHASNWNPKELDRGTYNINTARKIAIDFIKKYHENVYIERNFKEYITVREGYLPKSESIYYYAEYMDGEYLRENGPIMVLNNDGSIKKTYGRPKKKRTVKRK